MCTEYINYIDVQHTQNNIAWTWFYKQTSELRAPWYGVQCDALSSFIAEQQSVSIALALTQINFNKSTVRSCHYCVQHIFVCVCVPLCVQVRVCVWRVFMRLREAYTRFSAVVGAHGARVIRCHRRRRQRLSLRRRRGGERIEFDLIT